MHGSGHGCGNGGEGRRAKLLALLLGLLLWWPLVPDAAAFAHAVHAFVNRADVEGGAVGWSEQTPLQMSELTEAEDVGGKHTSPGPACSCVPAHVLWNGWARSEVRAYECVRVFAGHERLGRQRGPPIA